MGCLGKIFSSGRATACHQALVGKSETPARLAPAGVSGICCRLLRLIGFRPSTVCRVLRLPNVLRPPAHGAQQFLQRLPGTARLQSGNHQQGNGWNGASSSAGSHQSEDLIRIERGEKCKHLLDPITGGGLTFRCACRRKVPKTTGPVIKPRRTRPQGKVASCSNMSTGAAPTASADPCGP